jgi:hypothetical protein
MKACRCWRKVNKACPHVDSLRWHSEPKASQIFSSSLDFKLNPINEFAEPNRATIDSSCMIIAMIASISVAVVCKRS